MRTTVRMESGRIRRRAWAGVCVLLLAGGVPLVGAGAVGESPVADAVMHGDADAARALLRQGGDVNAAQGDGMTALHWAAQSDDLELTQMLLYAGANVKAATRLGAYTPLFMASANAHAPLVEALLRAGADVNGTTTHGATPLMMASATGDAAVVTALLDHGADPNAVEAAMGQTALMFASARNRPEAVAVLMERGADPTLATAVLDVPAREEAARDGRREYQRALEERLKQEREARALEAAARGEAEPEDARERQGEREARDDNGGGGRNPFVRFFTFSWLIPGKGGDADDGPDPLSYGELVGNHGGLNPLHFAARQGHHEATAALLAGGAEVDGVSGDHSTALLIATINGRFDLASWLLEQGADANLASDAGVTPLYGVVNVQWAPHAFYPQPDSSQEVVTHLDLLEALLAHGADPNLRLTKKVWYTGYNFDQSGVNEQGATPFWRAAQAADVAAMQLLVGGGADPTTPTLVVPSRRRGGDNNDSHYPEPRRPVGVAAVTPLQAASGAGYDGNYHRQDIGGFLPAVEYLVEELGADVSLADDKGNTPLHNAAFRGDNAMIRYLARQGADLTWVDRRGRNVSDWANGPIQRLQPFTETLALLNELGAPPHNDRCISC